MFIFDESKRKANLEKHGLDLADAFLVYNSPNKITLHSPRNNEERQMDIALVEIMGVAWVLVYVEHDQQIRFSSLRRASKQERIRYAKFQQNQLEQKFNMKHRMMRLFYGIQNQMFITLMMRMLLMLFGKLR